MAKETGDLEVTVKFGVDSHQIDVVTFLESLAGISASLDGINKAVGQPQQLKINIKATRQSSFLLTLGVVPPDVYDLLTKVDWAGVKLVFKVFVEVLSLKKLLKGESPDKVINSGDGDNVTVFAKEGSHVNISRNTFNIYGSNKEVRRQIERVFKRLDQDEAVDSIEIEVPETDAKFEAKREDFEGMTNPDEYLETESENTRTLERQVSLIIVKVVFFDKKRKWDFIIEGRKISAVITDDSFSERVDSGSEAFKAGDTLIAQLHITQELDPNLKTYVDKTYLVAKVFEHIPRPIQGTL